MTEPRRVEVAASGGCQCGAVRYRTSAMMDNAHICHCRMCQKAVGNLFAALFATPRNALTWTRGTPAKFMSSDQVARGFCSACGTPLFYDYLAASYVNLTMGSLDDAARFPAKGQHGIESRVPWFGGLCALQDYGTTEECMSEPAAAIEASNHQHPDRDD